MKTQIEIGKQGTLNGELLTVVSFNEKTFTCDNGKSYMIAFSKWMTDGVTVNVKKKVKKVKSCERGFYSEMSAEEYSRIENHMENAKFRQAGSSLRR